MNTIQNNSQIGANLTYSTPLQQPPNILKRTAIKVWSTICNLFDSIRIFFVRLRHGRLSGQHKELMTRIAQRNKATANLLTGNIQPKFTKDTTTVPEGMQDFYDQLTKLTGHTLETVCKDKLSTLDQNKLKTVLGEAKGAAKEFITKNLHLFAELDFSKLINSIVTIVQKHAETISKGEAEKTKELESLDEMIEKYEFLKNNPKTERFSDVIKQEILEFGKNLREAGGKEEEIKKIKARAAIQYYADSNFCHPDIKTIINPDPEHPNPEENAYTHLSEGLYSVIFPQQSVDVNGETKIVDGLIYQIFKTSKKMNISLNELIPGPFQGLTKQLPEQVYEILIPALVKSQIAAVLKDGFEMLIDPVKREQLFVSRLFPTVQEQMLIVMAKTEFSSCAKLFVNPQSNVDICKKMYEATKKSMVQYKKEFEKIDFNRFKEILMPEIENAREKIAEDHPNGKKPTEKSVAESIKKFVEGTSQENNPLFGNLVQTILCDLGQFGGVVQFFFSWIKGFISKIISNGVGEYQKDHKAIVKQITLQLKKQNEEFAKGPQLNQSIPNLNRPIATTEEEIEKTARLAYDIMQKKIQSAPYGTVSLLQYGAKQIMGQDHKYLSEVIQKIYKKMFSIPTIIDPNAPKEKDRVTQSLLFKILESSLSSLQDSAREVQKNIAHLPAPKMNAVPTVIACL